jgi:hypothetical protein
VTEREADPGRDRILDVIRDYLERNPGPTAEAETDGPVAFFVLERDGVPQGISGPYRAEPDAEPEPEAEP